jgi:4'-phosphopantetheinyl transferase
MVKGASRSSIGQLTARDRAVALPDDEVHVWRAKLDRPRHELDSFRSTLSVDEQARADRFVFERDRSRYIAGRGLLRSLLSLYIGLAPDEFRFTYSRFQKPALIQTRPCFNVSHSGHIALFAFSGRCDVGVDLELDDADFARERIAESFFSPAEVALLRSLPSAEQPRAFLQCWTRKEAFIKARGDGLSLPLDSFDVSFGPGAPAAVLRTAWSALEPARWRMQDLSEPEDGYIAAVALRSEGWRAIVKREPEDLPTLARRS